MDAHENMKYFGFYIYFNVIGLITPIARLAGRLEDGDCLPRALTPGVVDLVAAATNYVQPGDGKK